LSIGRVVYNYYMIDLTKLARKKKRKLPRLCVGEAIEKSGKTYQEIADEMEMNYYQNITKLKQADNINFKTLTALALVLDCKISDLIDE